MQEINETTPEEVTPAAIPAESAPAEEVKVEEAVSEEEGPLDLDAAEAAGDEPPVDEQEEPEPAPKPKSRFQERIDKLTADKYNAEREAEALRYRLHQMETREKAPIDYEDYNAVEKARLAEVLDERQMSETHEQMMSAAERANLVRQELFAEKIKAARAEIPDLDESLQTFAQLRVTPESAEIIAESDKAAQIAHYMGRNPHVADQIASLSPVQQGRAIAQIEARVTLPSKKVSTAPKPVSKVAAQQTPGVKSPAEMTAAEYLEYWKSTERAKR